MINLNEKCDYTVKRYRKEREIDKITKASKSLQKTNLWKFSIRTSVSWNSY